MKPLRAIVVDDEKLARRGLALRLANIAQVEVIAECANGQEALRVIGTEPPDLVFLDIQMPGMDGFDLVCELQAAAEGVPGAAIPAAGTGIRTVSIQYAPTEPSTESGRANLYARIKQAAREVCGPTGLRDAGGPTLVSRNRRCAEQAVSDTLAKVDSGCLATALN